MHAIYLKKKILFFFELLHILPTHHSWYSNIGHSNEIIHRWEITLTQDFVILRLGIDLFFLSNSLENCNGYVMPIEKAFCS